jgi:hypothetical protein
MAFGSYGASIEGGEVVGNNGRVLSVMNPINQNKQTKPNYYAHY